MKIPSKIILIKQWARSSNKKIKDQLYICVYFSNEYHHLIIEHCIITSWIKIIVALPQSSKPYYNIAKQIRPKPRVYHLFCFYNIDNPFYPACLMIHLFTIDIRPQTFVKVNSLKLKEVTYSKCKSDANLWLLTSRN